MAIACNRFANTTTIVGCGWHHRDWLRIASIPVGCDCRIETARRNLCPYAQSASASYRWNPPIAARSGRFHERLFHGKRLAIWFKQKWIDGNKHDT